MINAALKFNNMKKTLPEITPDTLYFIVVISCADGSIQIVTSAEKAEERIRRNPDFFTSWAYATVE